MLMYSNSKGKQIKVCTKAQADRESRCFQQPFVCGHLSEAVPYHKKSDINPACGATQPFGLGWRFETTSNDYMNIPITVKVGFGSFLRWNFACKDFVAMLIEEVSNGSFGLMNFYGF
jgi:hypothetical protein